VDNSVTQTNSDWNAIGGWVVADVKLGDKTINDVTFGWKNTLSRFTDAEENEISALSGGSPQ
jgi:hypothetical protein